MKRIIVIVGPTGSGKSEILKGLLNCNRDFSRVITSTTRNPRKGEVDGIDYHFITTSEFRYKIGHKEFLEFTQRQGNDGLDFYGTSVSSFKEEKTYLIILDVNGLIRLKEEFGEDNIFSVYINSPAKTRIERCIKRDNIATDEEMYKLFNRMIEDCEMCDYKKFSKSINNLKDSDIKDLVEELSNDIRCWIGETKSV